MVRTGQCEHARRSGHETTLHCDVLRRQGVKFDFCIYQFFCPISGKNELKEKAKECSYNA